MQISGGLSIPNPPPVGHEDVVAEIEGFCPNDHGIFMRENDALLLFFGEGDWFLVCFLYLIVALEFDTRDLWVLNGMHAIFYRVLARAGKGGAITDGPDHVDLPIKLLLWRGLVAGVGEVQHGKQAWPRLAPGRLLGMGLVFLKFFYLLEEETNGEISTWELILCRTARAKNLHTRIIELDVNFDWFFLTSPHHMPKFRINSVTMLSREDVVVLFHFGHVLAQGV
ncbi:unnamed protein product [Prunus armeniaca]